MVLRCWVAGAEEVAVINQQDVIRVHHGQETLLGMAPLRASGLLAQVGWGNEAHMWALGLVFFSWCIMVPVFCGCLRAALPRKCLLQWELFSPFARSLLGTYCSHRCCRVSRSVAWFWGCAPAVALDLSALRGHVWEK